MEKCKHKFVYSHTETNTETSGSGTTTDILQQYDVVVCEKCGEIKRVDKQKSYTENYNQ